MPMAGAHAGVARVQLDRAATRVVAEGGLLVPAVAHACRCKGEAPRTEGALRRAASRLLGLPGGRGCAAGCGGAPGAF